MQSRKGKEPDEEPSTMPGPSDATDAPMGGVWDPDSLDGSDVLPEKVNVEALKHLPGFEQDTPMYSGDPSTETVSSNTWIRRVVEYRREELQGVSNRLFVLAIKQRLTDQARRRINADEHHLPSALLVALRKASPRWEFQHALLKRIESGAAFADDDVMTIGTTLIKYYGELQGHQSAIPIMGEAIFQLFPDLWLQYGGEVGTMTDADFVAVLQNVAGNDGRRWRQSRVSWLQAAAR